MKKPRELKQGECEICLQETEVQRRMNSFDAWCCSPCLERMKAKGIQAARSARLFG